MATSIVLNIAEGNGRYSKADSRRFLAIAHESAVKMAAQIDLGVCRQEFLGGHANDGKGLLFRVASMTAVMSRGKQTDDVAPSSSPSSNRYS